MRSFSSFLLEQLILEARGTMSANADTRQGQRHVSQYLNPEMLKKTSYKLAGPAHGLEAGTEVKVKHVATQDGKFVAHIEHPSLNSPREVPISKLVKPEGIGRTASPEQKERSHQEAFQNEIENAKKESGQSEIHLHTPHGVVKVAGIKKVPGTPKADFALHNEQGHSTYFISHKDGSTVKDYQQLGGVGSHSDHPLVKKFVDAVKKKFPQGVSGQTVGMKFDMNNPEHKQLAHKMTFGNDHGSAEHGINNVHALVQGHMKLEKVPGAPEGHYKMTATNIHPNIKGKDSIPHGMNLQIQARAGDRADQGVKDTRITVNPVGSRKTHDVNTGERIND